MNDVATIKVPPIKHQVTREELLASIFYVPVNKDGAPVPYTEGPTSYEAYVIDAAQQRDKHLYAAKIWMGAVVLLKHLGRFVPYWDAVKDVDARSLQLANLRLKRRPEADTALVEVGTL